MSLKRGTNPAIGSHPTLSMRPIEAADAIEAATNAVHAMQTASDALEAISAARATTSVPAGNDHHVTVDPVVSPITTNGPNGRRGPADTTCWSLGIDVQRHRLAA